MVIPIGHHTARCPGIFRISSSRRRSWFGTRLRDWAERLWGVNQHQNDSNGVA
ncbi:hypothetical protein SKAU_G00115870 [Synaphobranchus kaupii]|uniref:Uncharacterized protein n=1 Tax=Synaphobranchus kaupii TaxID=118154 RepID=A0A9Q1FMK7_SYNKA|nr:hypothetical protein SKAU_G00115870 [Synaphobranchus kaupii]